MSTLATALVRDRAVRQQYADGVLWAGLGLEPAAVYWFLSWLYALTGRTPTSTTLDDLGARLRLAVQGKTVLVVLDDARTPTQVAPFVSAVGDSPILITTRRAGSLPRWPADDNYRLSGMDREQSMTLVTRFVGQQLTSGDASVAGEVVDMLRGVPFALILVAGCVKTGLPWAALVDDLSMRQDQYRSVLGKDDGLADSTDVHGRAVRSALTLSLDHLRRQNRDVWSRLIRLGILREGAAVGPRVAAVLWDTSDEEADTLLERLLDAGLIRRSVGALGDDVSYAMPDAVHRAAEDLLSAPQPKGLGVCLADAHAGFLERYWALTERGMWDSLEEDRYIGRHLAWHMVQAGWEEALVDTTSDEGADGLQYWEPEWPAHRRLGSSIDSGTAGGEPHREGLELELDLELPGPDLPEPVDSDERGVNDSSAVGELIMMAHRIVEPLDRALALVDVVDDVPSHQRDRTVEAAREAIAETSTAADRAIAYAALAGRLGGLEGAAAAQRALEEAGSAEAPSERAASLIRVAGHLAEPFRERALLTALRAARQIGDEDEQQRALTSLAPLLPELLREQVLRQIR
jgi:hypothetical protein